MDFMNNNCVAKKYFPHKCQGKYGAQGREIVFNHQEFEQYSETIETVHMCDFHYNWIITLSPLKMSGETLYDAIENDLLARFRDHTIFRIWRHYFKQCPKGDGTLYLLEGHEDDNMPLKGDNHIWELEGVFCYIQSTIFELVPVTKPDVMNWLSTNKVIYLYPAKTYERNSKETGSIVPEEYTNIARDFEFFGSYVDIKEYFWRKNEANEATVFQGCLSFMCDELTDSRIFDWNVVYGDYRVKMEDVYLMKKALVSGNQPTLDRYKQSYITCKPHLHAIMWVVYVSTNHEFYLNNSFGKTPDLYVDEKGYNRFWTNLVDMFVEEGLAKPLLCLAISGERQREVGIKKRDHNNIMHTNFEVVKMLIPAHVNAFDNIYDDLTPWQYWNCYDNRVFNIGSSVNGHDAYEEFSRDESIGNFLRPIQYQINGQREEIDGMETGEIQEENKSTNQEQVFQDIMKIYGVDRKGAEEKIDKMVKRVVVEHY